jgi:hypothetical protein
MKYFDLCSSISVIVHHVSNEDAPIMCNWKCWRYSHVNSFPRGVVSAPDKHCCAVALLPTEMPAQE